MEANIEQQIFEQVKKSNKILILLPQNPGPDTLASGLALRLFLERLQKDVSLVTFGKVEENLKFLPGLNSILHNIEGGKSLVITVNTKNKKMDEVSYQTTEGSVNIYLKSKTEQFTPQDLSFSTEKFPLDLIICLGARSLEDLGSLYEQHADLFFETPKINIDNKSGNEYFGQLNLVDITATSIAEILTVLFEKYEQQLVNEDIATCLLTGIIAQTNSFQHVHTTPKAFLKASELVSLGGRQQEVVKNIFKTKSLSLLKLWGRALARMKIYEPAGLIYSLLNFSDFEKSESSEAEVLLALKEFVDNIGGYKVVGLIAEARPGSFTLLAAVHQQVAVEKFLENLNSNARTLDINLGHYRVIEAKLLEGTLESLENRLLEVVKSL